MSLNIAQTIVEVNDKTYVINAFIGKKGFKYLARLTKHAAPVLAALTGQQEDEDTDITGILQGLFLEGTDEFADLILDIVSEVRDRDMNLINPDTEFKQNYMALLRLAYEVIKFNYSDVFQGLGMNLG